MCMCVCVCEREREREREGGIENKWGGGNMMQWMISVFVLSVIKRSIIPTVGSVI